MKNLLAILFVFNIYAQVDIAEDYHNEVERSLITKMNESRDIAQRVFINREVAVSNGAYSSFVIMSSVFLTVGAMNSLEARVKAWKQIMEIFETSIKKHGVAKTLENFKKAVSFEDRRFVKRASHSYVEAVKMSPENGKRFANRKIKNANILYWTTLAAGSAFNVYYFVETFFSFKDVEEVEDEFTENNISYIKNSDGRPITLQYSNEALLEMAYKDLSIAERIETEHIFLKHLEETYDIDPSWIIDPLGNIIRKAEGY